MTEKQVIREVLTLRGWSQQKLAEEAGFKSQSNINGLLNATSKGIRVDSLIKVLDAMGCEIVVKDKMGTKKEWVLTLAGAEPEQELTIEQQLAAGKISFEEAVALGWKPSQEMLAKMLGGGTK